MLSAAADRRKRFTIIGVEKVARRAGLSVPRTLFAYRELKDYGLIWRRRIRLGERQPYVTGLTTPGVGSVRGTPSRQMESVRVRSPF